MAIAEAKAGCLGIRLQTSRRVVTLEKIWSAAS